MISDLDETIRQLLIAELPIKNGEIEVAFEQPKREWSSRLSRPTINFFLYDLRENPVLRTHQWEQMNPGNNGDISRMKRTPFRVDCYYMLTTWAAEPEDEHRLLSRVLMTLFRHPVLSEDRLVDGLKPQPFPVPARLAQHDKLTNPAEVWSSLDNEMRPSISYIITLALDPWSEITGPIVRTLTFRAGQAISLPRRTGIEEVGQVEKNYIGGSLRKKKDKQPVPGVEVAVKGTGIFTTTDDQGHFVLGNLPKGDHTLVAWTGGDRPVEQAIHVPAVDSTYDIWV
jgi:hypothetical protein